ncbi:MAG: UvrD-helicase domain-containing protein, partial [Actinobacteria bacterium]|nr:UvrD-helicase domain-containing protein [Actinomycetota bacterium]
MSARQAHPVDRHHRKSIRDRLDETLFVEAGAGTGKTTELVARVLNLVESGIEMRLVAAITFTEAAAAELRSRIREALDRSAKEGSELAAKAVAEVDEAAVSTLHSFAQRILAEHSLEAGLPPVFEVRDEIQSGLAFEEWWAETLDETLDDPTLHSSWYRLLAVGLKASRLKLMAEILHDHWDRLDPRAAGGGIQPAPGDEADEALSAAIRKAVSALRAAGEAAADCNDPNDEVCQLLMTMGRLAESASARDETALLAGFGTLFDNRSAKKGRTNNARWVSGSAAATSARDAAIAAMDEARALACDLSTRRLLAAIAAKVLQAADERRRTGELEFHDLLVLARRLLSTRPEVRTRVKNRWQRILIDEFQDTDPIQVELAALLATQAETVIVGQLPDLEPGRLFFVGDARQSIYRFRRADVALFRSVADSLLETMIPLFQNFRSVPSITSWVNGVIGPLLGGQYTNLVPARKPLPGTKGTTVRLLGEASTSNLPAIREREADEIAWAIKCMVGAGGVHAAWPVAADKEGSVARDARYDDVAVLLPTRASLEYIERAFEDEKIPYRVESASLVWATQEVRDLLSCLRAIDDAGDEVAVVAALRSPILGCSDEDLLEWAQAGGRWRVGARLPEAIPPEHPVHIGLTKLAGLSEQRFWAGVSGLVEKAARELGFFELALAHSRSRDSWRRLRHVIDEVRSFERAGGATLRQFLVWADAQDAEGARIKEAVLPEPDHPAVRILTVHGAKGLEFPICILAGLNAKGAGPSLGRILWDGAGGMEARFNAQQLTSGFDALDQIEKQEEAEEDIRLLYVAATRAKDHLVVSVHHKAETSTQKSQWSHAATIWESCQAHPDLWTRLPAELPLSATPVDPPAPTEDLASERRAWAAAREAAIDELRRSAVRAATELKQTTDDTTERQPWQRGRGGTSLGRAVHSTLQTIDLATGEGLADTARAQAAAEGILHRADEVAARVRAALASSIAAEASQARYWRELYVGAPIEDLTVEGYIDLLYETGDGLVLVDWKTDAIDARREQAEAVARYGEQLSGYARVLEATLGRPVTRAVLVFLASHEAVEV